MSTDLQATLDDIAAHIAANAAEIERDTVADDHAGDVPGPFGIAVVTQDGSVFVAGDADRAFPIQSISKVFALECALEAIGDAVFDRVGREPSGDPFNSIIDLEHAEGIPRNPFINAGALVVVDMVLGLDDPEPADRRIVAFVHRQIACEAVPLDDAVLASGRTGGDLNRSLMYMARHFDNLHHPVESVMDAYMAQCAIELDCRQLALAGRFLLANATSDASRDDCEAARRARRIMALMMTCGQYDGSGDFAFRVGLPAKSGVGGGILAIAPGRASIAASSPHLDANGNSVLATRAIEMLADRMDWSVFGGSR